MFKNVDTPPYVKYYAGTTYPLGQDMHSGTPPDHRSSLAYRFRITRMALGLSQSQLSRETGISRQTINNSEADTDGGSWRLAVALWDRYRIDPMWIWRGYRANLDPKLAAKLDKIDRTLPKIEKLQRDLE